MPTKYEIGTLENDETGRWTTKGYRETTAGQLQKDINQGKYTTSGRVDRSDIFSLDTDEEILVLIRRKEIERPNPKRQQLQEDIEDLQQQDSDLASQLSIQKENRAETNQEVEDLQQQLEDLEQQREDLLEQAQQERQQGNISEAQSLEGQAGALTGNQIAEQNRLIDETQREAQRIKETIQELEQQRSNIQSKIQSKKKKLNNLQPLTTTEDVVDDIIIICSTEFETYIHGIYTQPGTGIASRQIEAEGTKIIRTGSRAPLQIRVDPQKDEDDFWDDLYDNIRSNVFRNSGGSPEGEWFEMLIQEIRDMGQAGSSGVFTGPNWNWSFGPLVTAHEFPEKDSFRDKKNENCADFIDLTM